MMISYQNLREKFVSNIIRADELFDMLQVYYPHEICNGENYRYFYKDTEITSEEFEKYLPDAEAELEEKLYEQCYIIDEQTAKRLIDVTDEIIFYFNDFDLWFWCIEKNNTPWDQLFTEVRL